MIQDKDYQSSHSTDDALELSSSNKMNRPFRQRLGGNIRRKRVLCSNKVLRLPVLKITEA
jgi:hypothetical protein